jgi:hypothetical protein
MMTALSGLSFVTDAAQAASVQDRWKGVSGRLFVVCLDEAVFPPADAAKVFDSTVKIIGLSELGLSPGQIMEEALALADDLFPPADQSGPARVQRWMIESLRRWLLQAVHSVRLIQTAIERFQPQQVWVPDYHSLNLTLAPDERNDNPLFFDLLPLICRESGIVVKGFRPPRQSGLLRRALTPFKYVAGQWLTKLKSREPKTVAGDRRPVILSNFDNDLHRQFDLSRLGQSAKLVSAWVREGEKIIAVDRLLERVGVPRTTGHNWFYNLNVSLQDIAEPAGVSIRPFAGLAHSVRDWFLKRREVARRRALETKYGVAWWDLLFTSRLPYAHTECRIASAYYCLFEYERARAMLLRWQPELFVASDYWTDLPKLSAARDLGIQTLATSSGIFFFRDEFLERSADTSCVYGEADAAKVAQGFPNTRVIIAGDALSAASPRHPARHKLGERAHVLFATSARMFGWWLGSLLFDYRLLMKALEECALRLRKLPVPVKVVIKSHPVSDLHDLYDQLVLKYSDVFVQHRREPMSEDEVAKFDAAVLFSAGTTFLAELIRAQLPVVYFSGGLTEFGKTCFDYRGLTVAEDIEGIISHLTRLLDRGAEATTARRETLRNGETFLERYIDPNRRSFSSVLEEVMGYKFEDPAETPAAYGSGSSGSFDSSASLIDLQA